MLTISNRSLRPILGTSPSTLRHSDRIKSALFLARWAAQRLSLEANVRTYGLKYGRGADEMVLQTSKRISTTTREVRPSFALSSPPPDSRMTRTDVWRNFGITIAFFIFFNLIQAWAVERFRHGADSPVRSLSSFLLLMVLTTQL